jgi:putative CocE/NonD family hydrolase
VLNNYQVSFLKDILLTALVVISFNSNGQYLLNLIREEVMIPMRDSVHLGAIVYRPANSGRYPVIIYRTPYGADAYDRLAAFPVMAAKSGYVVFITDVRGRYRSEGNFEAYRNEKEDGYDLIEWCAGRSYSNGQVVTYGGSYPGIVQWQAMSQAPPHLMAAAPEMTPIGSHHFIYYGGAFSHPWLDWFVPYIFSDKRKRAGDRTGTWIDDEAAKLWETSDRKKWYAYRPLIELPILNKYAPEYYSWLNHPDSSSWWNFVSVEQDFKRFTNPVFLESGWYDAAYGPVGATRAFNKMRTESATPISRNQTILMLGPWNHTSLNVRKQKYGEIDFGVNAGIDYDRILLDWFGYIIGKNALQQPLPRVSIFVMGENIWRTENEWPLSRARLTNFYLHHESDLNNHQSGVLNLILPETEQADVFEFNPEDPVWDKSYEKSYPYDHREIENRKDVLVYTTDVLVDDLEVTGEVQAELYVSSTALDTDFTFTLSDVYPDGKSINLHGLDAGYLRMRYRNGLGKQELIKPGEVYKIRIGNVYTSNLFKKGHRIRVSVSSSIAPHYDPNPNTGSVIATERNLLTATNRVWHDKQHPSRLILPVIPRNP